MGNVLIKDVPEEVLAAIDARAAKLGVSRVEYLRRRLFEDAEAMSLSVTVDELKDFANRYAELGGPEVMARAWD